MARHSASSYEIDMCSGSILPKLLQFALPLMCSSILQLLFNAADIIVVGRFAGDNSLAAVGSNTSIIALLTNLFIGLSVGANILAARFFGANDREGMHQTVHTAMLLSLISGAFLAVAGACGAKTILTWMQSPPEVLDLAALYLRIYFLGMPATMLYNFGAALLRAMGDTRRPLYFLFTAGIVNIVLNLFFVIVCQLDVAGVALATVISQCISAFLVVLCMIREEGPVHLELRQLRIWPQRLKQILQTGIPAGLQGVLFALSNVVIQSSINSFGSIIVAGNAAASNIENFVYVSLNAFYQANISFTSQNLGAGEIERARKGARFGILCSVTIAELIGGLIWLLAPVLIGAFNDSADVISYGVAQARTVTLFYCLLAFSHCMAGILRGAGRASVPMFVMLGCWCVFRILYITVAVSVVPSIRMVFWAYPITWSLSSVIFRLYARHSDWLHGGQPAAV